MTVWAMILIAGVLILILTGTLSTVFVFLAWIVVAIFVIAILYRLVASTFRHSLRPFRHFSEMRKLRGRIKKRQQLGYDTSDLERELAEKQDPQFLPKVRALQNQINKKRELGYDTSDLEKELEAKLGGNSDG